MEYKEAVAEARQLVKRSEEDQWRLAQLTWEQMRQNGVSARRWAEDVGIASHSYVSGLARVWERHGHLGAQRPRFAEAIREAHRPGEVAQEEEHGSAYQAQARQAVRNMPPEQKAEVVREALQDEQVAERVVRDTPTRARLAQTEHRIDREQQETARERYELAEPRSVQIGAMADLEYAAAKARQAFEDVREAADKLAAYNWPDDNRERSEALVQRAMAAGELALAAIRGQDLDEELKALVEGGDA
jgi:preprotein translocase subunit SecD